MRLFIQVFAFAILGGMLFVVYMTYRRDWGRKHYMKNRRLFPFSVIAASGEESFVRFYRGSVIAGTVAAAAFCVASLIG